MQREQETVPEVSTERIVWHCGQNGQPISVFLFDGRVCVPDCFGELGSAVSAVAVVLERERVMDVKWVSFVYHGSGLVFVIFVVFIIIILLFLFLGPSFAFGVWSAHGSWS